MAVDLAPPEPVDATETPRTQPPRQTLKMVPAASAKEPAWLEKPRAPAETTQVSQRIPAPPALEPERAFELVWSSRKLGTRLREVGEWALLVRPNTPSGMEAALVLAQAIPIEADLADVLFEGVANGVLVPKLVLLEGDLVLQEGGAEHASERRVLFGRAWIRARFEPAFPPSAGVPAYLPMPLSTRLPLFRRFSARVIAELVPRQEEADEGAVALKVAALARAVVR
jgi:hypothetical protein